jgi:hypothetical protein
VELLGASGAHVRFIPGALARSMVVSGVAEIAHQNGRVKSVRLGAAATSVARIIGPPTDGSKPPPFSVREKLDNGFVVWKHHARCWDYE